MKFDENNKFNHQQQNFIIKKQHFTSLNKINNNKENKMKARTQRIHFMGFSNRNPSTSMRTATSDMYQKSFMKSRSHYYQTTDKINTTTAHFNHSTSKTSQKPVSSTLLNINSVYKQAQKGHHHEFESKRFTNTQKNLLTFHQDHVHLAPLPLNFNHKLNTQIQDIRNEFKDKEINLHKLSELKHTFLINNEKRRNLKALFSQFSNSQNVVDKNGFRKLIKEYGYDINDHQVSLVFRLNKVHDRQNADRKEMDRLDMPQFINLMTKENVYFKTLKLNNKNEIPVSNSYKFTPPDFQVFRNKFPKLKEAFNVYKGQPIDAQKFQKIMKKLDINDLVIKETKRHQIFNQFSKQNGSLNVQQLLGVIATQQHQRVKRSGNQLKVTNYDNFQENINANQEFTFEKNQAKDPLLDVIYPVNLKKASFIDFERRTKFALQICNKLKEIKQSSNRDIINQLCPSNNIIHKQNLYKKVQKLLQSEGYNFSKNQYKSFIAYLDFDSANNISSHKLQSFVLNENEKQRVNRLDRRVRNEENRNQLLNEQSRQFKVADDQFVEKLRSKSSINWSTVKKSDIKQENLPQFKVPTKFSAWPSRLYNPDYSLLQAKSSFGIGITQNQRFHKDQKHSFGQQDRLRKLKIYQNKVRKIAEWSQVNQRRIEEKTNTDESKQAAKQYNLRLIKQKYQEKCSNNMAH